jgi:phospholipid/cholesterol/gamma-HCH transport system substrate-binding protein
MRSKLVRVQLVAFLIITVVGISYTGVRYVGLDRYFGASGYRVQMQLQNSGGIFENAEVTYRGVSVGRVGALSLTSTGVAAELVINDGAANIPQDLKAVVANRSAVGEQYVDLRPNTDAGPFLKSGSVIPEDRTSIPVSTQDLLASVDGLVRSVPRDSLQTVVRELGAAFKGTGPALQTLLDQGNLLTGAAIDAQPQTLKLIADAQTVLDTQRDQGSAIVSFSTNLKLITEQLQASDPDIRRLITTGQQAGSEVGALLDTTAPQLSATIANLGTVAGVTSARTGGLRAINQLVPVVAAATYTVTPGDGYAHFGLVLNVNDPFPCVAGYEGTYVELQKLKAADPNFNDSTMTSPLNTNAYCAEPQGSPISVRGAQHAKKVAGSPVLPAVQPGGAGFKPGSLNQDSGTLLNQLTGLLNGLLFGP